MNALFARHPRLDKGFGPALGPTAASALARFAAATGAVIIGGRSDWRLASNQRSLIEALVEHWAATAREMSPRHSVAIGSWAQRRSRQLRAGQLRIVVGHRDLLAMWPRGLGARPGRVQPASPASRACKRASHSCERRRASTT